MRIKIDTESKVIQLEQSAKLTELFALVKKLFPNDEWKQYSLESVQTIYDWNRPIYIPSVWGNLESQPFTITCTDNSETFCIQTN